MAFKARSPSCHDYGHGWIFSKNFGFGRMVLQVQEMFWIRISTLVYVLSRYFALCRMLFIQALNKLVLNLVTCYTWPRLEHFLTKNILRNCQQQMNPNT